MQPKSFRYISYHSKFEGNKAREESFLENIEKTGRYLLHLDIPSLHLTGRFQVNCEFFQANSK